MMYDYSTLLEHFTLFRTLATHGAGMDALCKPQANTKAKKFVNKDGVLHYITNE